MTEAMNQTMSEADLIRLVEQFEMDEALARSMQAQLNAEDGVTSSSSSTSTSTSSGQINSQSETRRFASGTSTTRLIVNGIETDMGNNQNNNNGTGSATGSSTGTSTGSSVRSSNSRIRRWTPELGIIPDSPSGNSGEHDSNRFPGSGNTLGDPVITRETTEDGPNRVRNVIRFNFANARLTMTPSGPSSTSTGRSHHTVHSQMIRLNSDGTADHVDHSENDGSPSTHDFQPTEVRSRVRIFVNGTQMQNEDGTFETLLNLTDVEQGLRPHEIEMLPETVLGSDFTDYECSVCLEPMVKGETIRTLPCFHRLHKDCIDPWLRNKKFCPVCRASVSMEDDN